MTACAIGLLMLPEPPTLQGGDLQEGGGLHLALGYRVHNVTKKNFKTHQSGDLESLLVKQSKGRHNPDMGAGTSDNNRCNECLNIKGIYGSLDGYYNWVEGWLEFTLGKLLPFVLTPGIISCFCCYTVLSTGPKDFKVDLLIKFE
jgi:hypothetical protein